MTGAVKPHRGLTTDRVVDAALRLADEGGLGALSVRRLAVDLGVTPMAIYRHVHDKNHLLDLMADRLIRGLDLGPHGAATWQERLRRLASNLLAVLEAHPAAPFLLSRPFESPAALRVSEAWLGILRSAGFDTGQSVRLLQVVTGMVLGPAIHRATYAAAWRHQPREAGETASGKGELHPGDFPYLSEAADQVMDWSPGSDADRVTIDLLVSGLEALASRPTRGSQQ